LAEVTQEQYLASLKTLFRWSGARTIEAGRTVIDFTVPPLASALRLTATFQDELDHQNEASLVLYVGEKPAYVGNAVLIRSSAAYSPSEKAILNIRTSGANSFVRLDVLVADRNGNTQAAGSRQVCTGKDGWFNTSLQELGIDVYGLLCEGYYSYVVMARFPSDEEARSFASFTVYRYHYSLSVNKGSYRAGEWVVPVLTVADECAGTGGAPADGDYLLRVRDPAGTLLQMQGRTSSGSASPGSHS